MWVSSDVIFTHPYMVIVGYQRLIHVVILDHMFKIISYRKNRFLIELKKILKMNSSCVTSNLIKRHNAIFNLRFRDWLSFMKRPKMEMLCLIYHAPCKLSVSQLRISSRYVHHMDNEEKKNVWIASKLTFHQHFSRSLSLWAWTYVNIALVTLTLIWRRKIHTR